MKNNVSNRLLYFLVTIVSLQCQTPAEPQEFNEMSTVSKHSDWLQVGFLIMDGVYNTELTAPFDIFQHTQYRDSIQPMHVFTIANTLKPIRTFEGLRLLPDYDYTAGDYPSIDILVIPSAEHHLDSDLDDQIMLDFVRKTDRTAQFITSHCDGAFVLAEAGQSARY